MNRNHRGQHGPDCYGCKVASLSLRTGAPQRHSIGGDPWRGNPVAERIEELQAQGRRVAAVEITKE